jgi:hypothetical protein
MPTMICPICKVSWRGTHSNHPCKCPKPDGFQGFCDDPDCDFCTKDADDFNIPKEAPCRSGIAPE